MSFVREDHNVEVKDDPLSDVMWSGTPNLDIQEDRRAVAQASAVADFIGMASGHRVERSITVSMYLWSSAGGRDLTTSTWIWEKRRSGIWKVPTPDSV